MRKFTLALLAATALAGTAAPALAQSWEGINARQANLDRRIDAGVRNGSLTPAEASRLRGEFREIVVLESTYRRSGGGLTAVERADLDRRFDILSRKIRDERRDNDDRGDDRGWQSINARQANLDRRIDAGIRNGSLTRAEAIKLRAEFQQIARLEAQYRRTGGGLTARERQDLDQRFDALSRRIRDERRDDNSWYGASGRLQTLGERIERAAQRGQLTPAEASRLRAEHRYLVQLEANYRRGGLTGQERAELNRRFDLLATKIRWERRDWDIR